MDAHDVSPIVNSAKYDGPDCIQAVSRGRRTSCRAVISLVTAVKPYHFGLYALAFMQLSKICSLLSPPGNVASRSHSDKSRKRSLSLWFLVSLNPGGCWVAHPATNIAATMSDRNFIHLHSSSFDLSANCL